MNVGYGIPERLVRIAIVLAVVFLILAVLVILVATQRAEALTDPKLLGHIVEQVLIYATVAAGMSLVLAAGEADLSISGTVSLTAIVTAGLMVNNHVSAPGAIAVALGLGLVVGLVNGLLITLLRLPFYIVTLAMLGLTTGLALFLSNGRSLVVASESFGWSWPLLLVLNLVVYGLGVLALLLLGRFTSLGKLTSLNARSEAGGRPGSVALGLYKIGAYAVSGLLAAVAGLAMLNYVKVATPTGYGDLTTMAIAAAVIGGVPLWKGSTRLLGAFLGSVALVLIVQVINLAQLRNAAQVPTVLAWTGLALLAAILWGLAGWVLDLIFGRRKRGSG